MSRHRRILLTAVLVAATAPSGASAASSGGVGVTTSAAKPTAAVPAPAPPGRHGHGKWLAKVTITEYWPAPESWFVGKLVSAPGLSGKHRIDWLYSAQGISMEGDGIGLDGQLYRIDSLGDGGWITSAGKPTDPLASFAQGAPYWRAGGYWRTRRGAPTFPLSAGGWANGTGRHYVPLKGVSFASGSSLPLRPLQSIAVDPTVIPLGSRVYIPAYRGDGHGGWFQAQDTGGAITGHHIDVYRSPPPSATDSGQFRTGQRIYVIPPAAH